MQQKIIILDFGSQTTQLIGRRVRELDTFCEILPYNKFPHDDPSVIGVILSGSPFSVYDPEAFKVDLSKIRGRLPILGICYGAQYMAQLYGGKVEPAASREYGRANLQTIEHDNPLFKDFIPNSQVWMSHGDTITAIPDHFRCIASTPEVKFAAYQAENEALWGVQFHPEVFHSLQGSQLLSNFVVDICGSRQDWSAASFVDSTVAELREQLGNDRVILGLSGGVDSSVAAVLLHKAIGDRLTCIFVDHGLLRKDEFKTVMDDYKCLGLNVIGVDASDKFFAELAGVEEPERKRKIIGAGFIDVFDAEAMKITGCKVVGAGHHLPGPHRIAQHYRQGHQESPQCRWTAGENELAHLRTVEVALQRRGAPRRTPNGHARTPHQSPPLPRSRTGGAHSRRHHARESTGAARS